MMDLDRLQETLKRHEGLSLKPYTDSVGKLTIGVGRNLDDRGITLDEAEHMLSTDTKISIREAAALPFWVLLSPVRQEVIVNMLFNMGLPRFLGFKKMIAALENKDYNAAAFEMLNSRWADQVGYRAEELADMMKCDRYIK